MPALSPTRSLRSLVTVACSVLLLVACGGAGSGTPSASPVPTATSTTTVTVTVTTPAPPSGPTSGPTSAATGTRTGSATATTEPALPGRLLPLWPFTGPAAVTAWQHAYRANGSQPWHLSERDTALGFAHGYLGYTEVDRVTSRTGSATDALVGVGWLAPLEGGRATTVGLVHVVRFGSGPDAPWEVVGTRDAVLSLTTPHYGSTVGSPVVVGGRITGVDESLVVTVHRAASGSRPVGTAGPLPAGGEDTPWSTPVAFDARPGDVLTVAVSTGGHLMGVEAFAVTGLRVGPVR